MHFTTILLWLAPFALGLPTATSETATPAQLEARAACNGISDRNADVVKDKFADSGVVPTLIPSINPKVSVAVSYGTKQVQLGNRFTTAQTTMQPNYTFTAENGKPAGTTYSFFMVDPDVPDQKGPHRMPYLHWYVAHATPKCAGAQNGTAVTVYESPSPLSTTQHRYTFLVYREPPGYMPNVAAAQIRPGFNVVTYTQSAGLVLVGGNFFREAVTNT